MALHGLLELAEAAPGFDGLAERLAGGGEASAGMIDAAKPLLLAALWRRLRRPMAIIVARAETARLLHEQTLAYAGEDAPAYVLPELDSTPYERLASDRSTVSQRVAALWTLGASADSGRDGSTPPLLIGSAYAFASKTLDPKHMAGLTHTIRRGGRLDPMQALRRWTSMGYRVEPAVEVPGDVSRRGGILDIFPPSSERPVRIDLFGDTIDAIRFFDPESQRSLDPVQSVTITPATELTPEDDRPPRLDTADLAEGSRERVEADLEKLAAGEPFDEQDFYRGLAARRPATAHLPKGGIVVLDNPRRIGDALDEVHAQAVELRERLASRGELPAALPAPYASLDDIRAPVQRGAVLTFEPFGADDAAWPFTPPPSYSGRTRALIEDAPRMRGEGRRVVLVSQQAPRLSELLEEAGVTATPSESLPDLPPLGSVTLVHGSLAEGWALDAEQTTVLTDAEIFGLSKQRRYRRKRAALRQSFLSELTPGDYVVHIDHGIGRFAGVMLRKTAEREREYLVLEYAQRDRLLIPMDQIDRVGPYLGSGERTPSLTRLGTQEWNRVKARVKASAEAVARDLLDLYASREVASGRPFGPDTPWQQELEASFPYVETPDQQRAIDEVKEDMESPKPMDRVITGDVGYGKTEVALRAAFKAVMEGTQTAILVPTTVLALQHLETFSQRLAPFPVKVEMLSRFRSPKEQAAITAELQSGGVDIVIGTHRLLQKDVAFKDLGLVVIDEEQRFGVSHKERLKQLRKEVDVLSMSATPIPRTLYMSLAGVRDMSVMETPPEERLPIKTYVSPRDGPTMREAVLREMERGGQVFLVHNRVYNIGIVAERLRKLVPEARVLVAHGQMPEQQLESVMLAFQRYEADVLVTTTIIESGLDMPNVNTLIVNDADRMGLAQLYQLRGRVGRGANRAYAYFFFHPDKKLKETAERRLKTILSATELGAGFRIAMKDLEIRGAGNILGVEQHGHIAAVGFDLYVRLLGETVEELRAGYEGKPPPPPKRAQASIDLPAPAHLPHDYVADLPARLALYQRMTALHEPTDVDRLAEELRDRYGEMPEETENLLFMLKVKLLATKAGVVSVSERSGEVVLAGDERTWTGILGVQRPYGDGVRVGNTRVRLDIKRLGKGWRNVLERMLTEAGAAGPAA